MVKLHLLILHWQPLTPLYVKPSVPIDGVLTSYIDSIVLEFCLSFLRQLAARFSSRRTTWQLSFQLCFLPPCMMLFEDWSATRSLAMQS